MSVLIRLEPLASLPCWWSSHRAERLSVMHFAYEQFWERVCMELEPLLKR